MEGRLRVHNVNVFNLTPETASTVVAAEAYPCVGFSIQDEVMDAARSAPQGANYHADNIYLLP